MLNWINFSESNCENNHLVQNSSYKYKSRLQVKYKCFTLNENLRTYGEGVMLWFKKVFLVLLISVLPFIAQAKPTADEPTAEWMSFLNELKSDMLKRGISQKTIDKAYGSNTYYHKAPDVVSKDKKQAEFILTSKDYINRLVNPHRIEKARRYYQKLQKDYPDLEKEYGVPLNYLTAFWAVETNFGENKGKYHLIDGLTNLSYKNRRSAFFKNELYNVLKIMEKYDLKNDKMLGSWAGAMGHFQFMPSTYNAYAVDYDGDGVADIWDSFDDAVGSAANYLHNLGWKADEPWGGVVRLPWNFNYLNSGYKVQKTVKEWSDLGVKTVDNKKLNWKSDLKGALIIPDGRKGAAYLVFGNFRRIMIWNRSENYALTVGILADYINSEVPHKEINNVQQYKLTDKEVKEVQAFANKLLRTKLKEDGILGPQTKKAVRKLQAKAGMHQDGYPDWQLLNKIRHYNAKTGFIVPVQPPKNIKNSQAQNGTGRKAKSKLN